MNQLQNNIFNYSVKQLRALNELPTLFLVIVVMLVVFKNQFSTNTSTWFIVGLVVLWPQVFNFILVGDVSKRPF